MNSVTRDSQKALQSQSGLRRVLDGGFIRLTQLFALAVAGILIWMTVQVAIQASPAIHEFGANFIFSSSWNPVKDEYGALPQIYGTAVSSLIALLLAVPVGVGVAIFLSEDFLPPRINAVLVLLVELLASIP